MFDTIYSQAGAIFTIAVVLFALFKGEEPERIVAGAFGIGWLASLLIQNDGELYGVQWGIFGIDLIMLLLLAGMAWRSGRVWPVWATGFQLLTVASHVMLMVDLRASVKAFYWVLNICTYGVLLSLAIGAFWVWQERRAAGLE